MIIRWSRYASATRNKYRNGTAWYLGSMPDEKTLRSCLKDACKDARIEIPSCRWPVVCRHGYVPDGRELLFIFNYSSEPVTTASPLFGTDLLTGKCYSAGDIIHLTDWGATVP